MSQVGVRGASVCDTGDCSCGDWYYDECGVHTPSQALHVGGIQECFDNCQVREGLYKIVEDSINAMLFATK